MKRGLVGEHASEDMTPANWAKSLDRGRWGCFSKAYLNVRPQVFDCQGAATSQ
jgi:hypothetical protein